MKKIIEISTLFVVLVAIVIVDFSIINKSAQEKSDRVYALEQNYQKAKRDANKITLVTFDEYMINKINEEEERKEREYQEYLKSLIVYDGLTMDQLAEKLNKSLKNELSGYGYLYASYSLENGVDPYIAVAISLHETGCNARCSVLMTSCNNVGGQKGSPTCGSGSYKQFNTLEEGIKGYIDNLSRNYFGMGLNTPELMAKKYAQSTSWASRVNSYIETIKTR